MKNIYLIQPSDLRGNSVYLPYSVGAIAAYAWEDDVIRQNYDLKPFGFWKEPVADVLERMETPYFVGFSCYMWNVDYNISLANAIHQKFPECIIAFGGPQIPNDTEYLQKYPFIHILMHGEGERTFRSLLLHLLSGECLSDIPNLSFRLNDEIIHTEQKIYRDVTIFPSPYAGGFFSSIVDDPKYAHLQFDAVLETNRGCPYGCIYCCWAGTESNFRTFPMERVTEDLEWMATHNVVFCLCADSNFGILERDKEIARQIVELKKQYGFPKKFETASAKNKDDTVFEINSILESGGLNCGISVAVQSFSPTVLKNIGRSNISLDNFSNQLRRYRECNMATYTDLIVGLPGETFDSFCQGIFKAVEAGQHVSINIHPCELLPNTRLALPETIEKYKIRTICSTYCQDHSNRHSDVFASRSEIVVETDTMSKADWRNIMRISTCVQSLHAFGLLRYFAIYCRRAKQISYYDFYMGLYRWIETESTFLKATLDHVCHTIDSFLEEKSSMYFWEEKFSNMYIPFKEALFLYCAEQKDRFYEEIQAYVQDLIPEADVREDLTRYQHALISIPKLPAQTLAFRYNWDAYFADIFDTGYSVPDKAETHITFEGNNIADWNQYVRDVLWFGKRSNKMLNKTEVKTAQTSDK